MPVFDAFGLGASNRDGFHQFPCCRFSKGQRKGALAGKQSNQGVVEVLVEFRVGRQLHSLGHEGCSGLFEQLQVVASLPQRHEQRVVLGHIGHPRTQGLGPRRLRGSDTTLNLLALAQKISEVLGLVKGIKRGVRQRQNRACLNLGFNRLGAYQVAMERQHVDPLRKLIGLGHGGSHIDQVVTHCLASLAQGGNVSVRDRQLLDLRGFVIEPLVLFGLLEHFPGHLFRADLLAA